MRRVVISFSAAVLGVILLIAYYALQRATITLEVEPANEVMEAQLTIGPQATEIQGTILQTEVSQSKTFTASPSGEREPRASGKVVIMSTHTNPQTLIATTRLLSPEGVLFRLQNTITVPASGRIEAEVIADQPGEASEIAPTKFTIPGLNATLREKIYAESSEPMRRAEKPGNRVTALDLEQAKKTLRDSSVPQALAKLREQLPSDKRTQSVVYTTEDTVAESDTSVGTQKATFAYTLGLKITAIFYDPTHLREQTLQKLQGLTTNGRSILTLEEQSVAVTIEQIASDLSQAELKVKFLAKVTISDASQAINVSDLLGRTPEEVANYFDNMSGIRQATVELSPFWTRAVPTTPRHIRLEVKD